MRFFKRSDKAPPSNPAGGRCRLLELPLELQLQIYELVVYDSKPHLLNMPCNSSFRADTIVMRLEAKAWDTGKRHPPLQPAITKTCKSIRDETLPLFYGGNVFRACYCYPKDMLPPVIAWLKMIGKENREMLRHFYFYDRNERQDFYSKALKDLEEAEIFSGMQGRMETMSGEDCCCHLVAFGDWTRRDGQVPIGLEPGVPRLRLEGEI